jgi:hypothetical protein
MKHRVLRAMTLCLCLTGCRSERPVESYGTDVITVSGDFEKEVGIALVEVHRRMANWVQKADGTQSDPTYKAGSHTGKSGRGPDEKPEKTCSRSYVEFTTADGQPVRIETIAPSGKPILILLKAEREDTLVRLHNLLVEDLQSRCAAP